MALNIIYSTIDILFSVLVAAIFIRVILSWVSNNFEHPLARLIFELTEPILAPIRNILPKSGMIDFSPLVAMIALGLLRELIFFILRSF